MPRKESHDIAEAFFHRRPCKRKRTTTDGDNVYLHGNKIAWRDDYDIVHLTLCGWGTVTTRDRLNAICEFFDRGRCFYQAKGEQYYNERQIDANEVIPLTSPLHALVLEAERRLAA